MKIRKEYDYHEFLNKVKEDISFSTITSKKDLESMINKEIERVKESQQDYTDTDIKISYTIDLIKFKLVVLTGVYDSMDKATREKISMIIKLVEKR